MATAQVSTTGVGIRNVLITTDLSHFSDTVINFGLRFAKDCRASAFIVSVVPSDQYLMAGPEVFVAARDAARRDLEQLEVELRRARCHVEGDSFRIFLLEGDIAHAILEFVREKQIDLILVGTHGRGGLQKALLGSVAERIFRSSPVPVVTLGPEVSGTDCQEPSGEILVTADFTAASKRAVQYAVALRRERGCNLTLLHVIDPKSLEHVPDRAAVERGLESRLAAMLGGDAGGAHCSIRIRVGPVSPTILEVARERRADLLVMGVRPSSGVLDRLRIPHAYEVIREATCPVLTLREPKPDFDLN